jgi:hypothetical protein
MANLLGQNIGTNYKGILNLDTINTPLDATLRAVTDGEGNASLLELSTTAVSVGAISGARFAIKGSGTTFATNSLLVQNSAGTDLLKIRDDGQITCAGAIQAAGIIGTTYGLFGGASYLSASVGIKGSGTTASQLLCRRECVKGSGTTALKRNHNKSLLVQNNAGTAALTVKDDLQVAFSGIVTFDNNLTLNGANGTSSLNNLRFIVPGATKSFVINADYSFANQASALLEVQSTTKGFLPPRMTTTQKNAIATPAAGLVVYDSTTNKLACYNGTTWNDLF